MEPDLNYYIKGLKDIVDLYEQACYLMINADQYDQNIAGHFKLQIGEMSAKLAAKVRRDITE